jgi:hypothetical protein
MRRVREVLLVLLVLSGLTGGVLFDLRTEEIAPTSAEEAEPVFAARSIFCPPAPAGGESNARIAVAAPSGKALPLGIEEDRFDLGEKRLLMHENAVPTSLVGYGGEVAGTSLVAFTGKDSGLGSARCSKSAATRWYFAEGSSALGVEERLIIYNPFPDEAVVRVSLITPEGEETSAGLTEGQAVPAGESLIIELNEYVKQRRFLAASVVADRGRVVAWRALQLSGHHRMEGVQFSLGATAPSTQWYFPEGGVGQGLATRVSLFNPTQEEAIATVSLVTGDETKQPPKLVDVAIPPGGLLPVAFSNFVSGPDRELGGAGVVVRTSTGAVVAERSVYYGTPSLSGVASEIGAARTAADWLLAPAVPAPEVDEVVLLNPGTAQVAVDLSLMSETADPLVPTELQNVVVPAGTRLTVPIQGWTSGESYGVMVRGDGPLVAERFASMGPEVASVMGLPLVRQNGR